MQVKKIKVLKCDSLFRVVNKILITIIGNNIDLSRLIVTAFENNNNNNKDINIVLLYENESSLF